MTVSMALPINVATGYYQELMLMEEVQDLRLDVLDNMIIIRFNYHDGLSSGSNIDMIVCHETDTYDILQYSDANAGWDTKLLQSTQDLADFFVKAIKQLKGEA